jgi:hypothetical protein
MDKRLEQGFHDEEELYKHMVEHHRDLMRKGKKGVIGQAQMMKQDRKARGTKQQGI